MCLLFSSVVDCVLQLPALQISSFAGCVRRFPFAGLQIWFAVSSVAECVLQFSVLQFVFLWSSPSVGTCSKDVALSVVQFQTS